MEQEEREPSRPRVVDKRVSARRAAGETSSPPPPSTPPAATSPPAASPPPQAPPVETAAPGAGEDTGSTPPPEPGTTERPWTPEQEAEAQRMSEEMARISSAEWVVNVAVTLANVAGAKLEQGGTADAKLAIDALSGLVNAVGGELAEAEAALRQTVAQLQMAYVRGGSPAG